MEADWEVEIGGEAPVIDAAWSGFADLRIAPHLAHTLPEASVQPGLAEALVRLNQSHSPVWTAKCDAWPITDTGPLDPDELGAASEDMNSGRGCYIDLLPRSDQQWTTPEMAVHWCKALCSYLRTIPLPCGRIDLVVRKAWITPDIEDHGLTAYFTACGCNDLLASQTLAAMLHVFADALVPTQR